MDEQYVQGFEDRCAERNVDPEQLVKFSDRLDRTVGLAAELGEKGPSGVLGENPMTWYGRETGRNLGDYMRNDPEGIAYRRGVGPAGHGSSPVFSSVGRRMYGAPGAGEAGHSLASLARVLRRYAKLARGVRL